MSVRTVKASIPVAVAVAVAATVSVAGPAAAAATESAVLTCGSAAFSVTGFGRGQVLHVQDSTRRFVVTYAELADGRVVFEAPGQVGGADVLTCTTTAPGPDGRSYTFRGFFTPRT